MVISFNNRGKALLVSLSGELDHHSADSVRIKLDNKLEELGDINLILDFSGIHFMDSSGIGTVIGRYKRISEHGGQVAIINLKPEIRKVFELSGLFKIIKEYNNAEDALKSFRG